ncbi:hypothetical protein D3C80_1064320 [compost metagenome]
MYRGGRGLRNYTLLTDHGEERTRFLTELERAEHHEIQISIEVNFELQPSKVHRLTLSEELPQCVVEHDRQFVVRLNASSL